jgi:hypothetical protein
MAKRTPKDYVRAIKKAGGLVAPAAQALGVERATVYGMAKRHPTVAAAIKDAREDILDMAESKVFAAANGGNLQMCTYLLDRLGAERGYLPKQEINLPGLSPRELAGMSDTELEERARELGI